MWASGAYDGSSILPGDTLRSAQGKLFTLRSGATKRAYISMVEYLVRNEEIRVRFSVGPHENLYKISNVKNGEKN